MLETARVLLKLEIVRSRIEEGEGAAVAVDSSSVTSQAAGTTSGFRLGGVVAGGVGSGGGGRDRVRRDDDEEEEAKLSWKIGRLMEIFLSPEIQVPHSTHDILCIARTACARYAYCYLFFSRYCHDNPFMGDKPR